MTTVVENTVLGLDSEISGVIVMIVVDFMMDRGGVTTTTVVLSDSSEEGDVVGMTAVVWVLIDVGVVAGPP